MFPVSAFLCLIMFRFRPLLISNQSHLFNHKSNRKQQCKPHRAFFLCSYDCFHIIIFSNLHANTFSQLHIHIQRCSSSCSCFHMSTCQISKKIVSTNPIAQSQSDIIVLRIQHERWLASCVATFKSPFSSLGNGTSIICRHLGLRHVWQRTATFAQKCLRILEFLKDFETF